MWQQLGVLLLVAGFLIGLLVRSLPKLRLHPGEKERRRRRHLYLTGRMGDAEITEARDNSLFYAYSVGGVAYTAAQDISDLRQFFPEDPERLIGPVQMKYTPGNPANSIIVCEDWSGLRPLGRVASGLRNKTVRPIESHPLQ